MSLQVTILQSSFRITKSSNNIPCFHFKRNFIKNSFFSSAIIKWNNLDISIRNSENLSNFKKSILQLIRSSPSSTYSCFCNKGIKHITTLRHRLTYLRDQKFKHGFLDSPYLICRLSSGLHIKTTCHYLLHCPNFPENCFRYKQR